MTRDIPARELTVDYFGSASGSGDEMFSVGVRTTRSQLMPASLAVASVLSEICSKGVEVNEYLVARNSVLSGYYKPQTNDALVQRCVSSYLYGSDLAAPATKATFYSSRNMSAEAETDLFNSYAAALLSDMKTPKPRPPTASLCWTSLPTNGGRPSRTRPPCGTRKTRSR